MSPFWKTWMRIWCWAVLAFGVVLLGAAHPALSGPTALFYDLVHWPLDGASSFVETTRFSAAIIGAITVGWALMMFTLTDVAHIAPPLLAQRLWGGLTAAMTVWYCIDSSVSIATGAVVNAISNSLIFGAFLAPVLASGVLARAPVARNA